MIEKRYNKLYLIDNASQDEITIDLSSYYCDVDIRIKSKYKTDTFVKIGTDQPSAFESFDKCFNSIMTQYENESESERKYRYDSIWFVDKYNKVITFYSDKNPISESNAFTIRKCIDDEAEYFELSMYYVKGSYSERITLTNDYGRYMPYIPFLVTLHNELKIIAKERIESQIINQPNIMVLEPELQEEKPKGIKTRIRSLFGKRR